ncbi:MAG TPA: SDR family NAD(P)-dependent oxidoreductase [Acidimicrobiales bacterium]|jgi:NAD(P)-dependent dehydrogenase (short-subunit alcohol dehydrogenase family)|nr:SDR family NAD(P)-dependent oxidoreductase [Acidimicrobiales bacterium]
MNAELRDLHGKVALVTGASRGVGAATAVALAQAGCAVACAARATAENPLRLPGTIDETVARIEAFGGEALAVPTNLVLEEDIVRMVARTVDHFGRVDLLVNNAAITFVGDLTIPLKRYELVMDVNVRAPLIAIREVAPHMRAAGGGSIVNVSSAASLIPIPGMMAYGMSKIALEHLTMDAARELYPDGTAVNCFRIDISVASEGYVANAPSSDHETWEPTEVPAEGIVWMLRQPMPYSGRRESMHLLREREGIMASRSNRPNRSAPPTQLFDGLFLDSPYTNFVDG